MPAGASMSRSTTISAADGRSRCVAELPFGLAPIFRFRPCVVKAREHGRRSSLSLSSCDWGSRCLADGSAIDELSPKALGDWQNAEIAKWRPMIKAADVKVE